MGQESFKADGCLNRAWPISIRFLAQLAVLQVIVVHLLGTSADNITQKCLHFPLYSMYIS